MVQLLLLQMGGDGSVDELIVIQAIGSMTGIRD
jgi:hypothetical protein